MSRKTLKARGRITQKMSRAGAVQRNERTGEDIRISNREADFDIRSETPNMHTPSDIRGYSPEYEISTDHTKGQNVKSIGKTSNRAASGQSLSQVGTRSEETDNLKKSSRRRQGESFRKSQNPNAVSEQSGIGLPTNQSVESPKPGTTVVNGITANIGQTEILTPTHAAPHKPPPITSSGSPCYSTSTNAESNRSRENIAYRREQHTAIQHEPPTDNSFSHAPIANSPSSLKHKTQKSAQQPQTKQSHNADTIPAPRQQAAESSVNSRPPPQTDDGKHRTRRTLSYKSLFNISLKSSERKPK